MKKGGASAIKLNKNTKIENNIKKYKKENFYISYGKLKSKLLTNILDDLTSVKYFVKNYIINDMGLKKNIKGGAELNDNGKLFLRILDIFDSKHDFEKPDKSLKNIDDFLDEFLDKNSKNINMLFGELPKSDINIIYKFETLLYKQKTEDELLLYGIDNLLGLGGDNLSDKIDITKISFLDLNKLKNHYRNTDSSVLYSSSVAPDVSIYNRLLTNEIKNNLDLNEINKNKNKYIIDTSIAINHNRSAVTWTTISNILNSLSTEMRCLETKWDPHINKQIDIGAYTIEELNNITNNIFNINNKYNSAFKELTQKYFGLTYTNFNDIYYPFLYFKQIDKVLSLKSKISLNNNKKINDLYNIYYHTNNDKYGIFWDYSGIPISAIKEKINEIMDSKKFTDEIVDDVSEPKYNIILNVIVDLYLAFAINDIKKERYKVIEILLDFKKSGDWGQALFCHYTNILNSKRSPSHELYNTNTFFITIDKLSALHSLLRLNVKTLFSVNSKKFLNIKENVNVLGFYNPDLNITYKYLKNLLNSIFSEYDDIIDTVEWNSENIIDLNYLNDILKVKDLINYKVDKIKAYLSMKYNKEIINTSSKIRLFLSLVNKHFKNIEIITDISQIFKYLTEISNYLEMYIFTFINIEEKSDTQLGYYINKINTNITSFLETPLFEKIFSINIETVGEIIRKNDNMIRYISKINNEFFIPIHERYKESLPKEDYKKIDNIELRILYGNNVDINKKIGVNKKRKRDEDKKNSSISKSILFKLINYILDENLDDEDEYINNILIKDYKDIYDVDNNTEINNDLNKELIINLYNLKQLNFLQNLSNCYDIYDIINKIIITINILNKENFDLNQNRLGKYYDIQEQNRGKLIDFDLIKKEKSKMSVLTAKDFKGYDNSNYTELIDFMFDIDQFEIEKIKRITTTGISTYRRNIKNKGTKTLISLTNAVILELSNNTLFSKSFNLQYLCIKELINSLLINITNSNNTVIEKCIDVFNLSDEEKSIKKILSDYYNEKYMNEFKNNLDRIRHVLTIYIKKIFNYVEKIFNDDIDKKLRISFDDYKDKNKKIDRTSQSTMKDIKKTINRDKDLKTINMIINEYNKDYKMFIKKIEDVSKIFTE